MDSLVTTMVSLPLEAQALALFSLALVMAATARLFGGRRQPAPGIVRKTPDPILAPESPRPPNGVPEGVDFDSQETLIPNRHSATRPLEQIDLLSPAMDEPRQSGVVPDADTLTNAKRLVETAALRLQRMGTGDDNLTAIRGLSPSHAHTLKRLGIRRFEQLAELSEDEVAALALVVSTPLIQIVSDDWVGQARAAARRAQQRSQNL